MSDLRRADDGRCAWVRPLRSISLVAVGLLSSLVLTGCNGGVAVPVADACNRVLAWSSAGVPADQGSDVVADVKRSLRETDEERLVEALASIESVVDADEAERAAAAEAFQTVCNELGWEFPEG